MQPPTFAQRVRFRLDANTALQHAHNATVSRTWPHQYDAAGRDAEAREFHACIEDAAIERLRASLEAAGANEAGPSLASKPVRAPGYVRCEKHHGERGLGAIVPTCEGCKASALSSGVTEEQWGAFVERERLRKLDRAG